MRNPESKADDAALIEETLQIAALRADDLTPAVYARFFARCPDAAELFAVLDPSQPPLGCGQMLFEALALLRDSAAGEPYVASYIGNIAREHQDRRVTDPALYRQFMWAFRDVVASLVGTDWSELHERAWSHQVERLLVPISSDLPRPWPG